MQSSQKPTPEFIDLLLWVALACAKRIRFIVFTSLFVAIVSSFIVVFILDSEYESKAIILPPSDGTSSLMGSLGDLAGDLGPLVSKMGIGGMSSSGANILLTVANSYQFQRTLIREFKLDSIYKFTSEKTYFEADLMKTFRRNFLISLDDETDYVVVSMRDKDPQRAKSIVDSAVAQLNAEYVNIKVRQAGKSRSFFESRLAINQNMLDSLKGALQTFQESNHIISPKVQMEESIKRIAELETQKDLAFIQWQAEVQTSGIESSFSKRLYQQYSAINIRLNDLKSSGTASGALVNLGRAPQMVRKYEEIEDGIQIQQAIFKSLRQMYEQALLQEVDKVGRIEVLEKPWVNNKRVAPPRRAIVTSLVLASIVLSILVCVIFEAYFSEQATQGSRYKMINEIVRCIPFRRQ